MSGQCVLNDSAAGAPAPRAHSIYTANERPRVGVAQHRFMSHTTASKMRKPQPHNPFKRDYLANRIDSSVTTSSRA